MLWQNILHLCASLVMTSLQKNIIVVCWLPVSGISSLPHSHMGYSQAHVLYVQCYCVREVPNHTLSVCVWPAVCVHFLVARRHQCTLMHTHVTVTWYQNVYVHLLNCVQQLNSVSHWMQPANNGQERHRISQWIDKMNITWAYQTWCIMMMLLASLLWSLTQVMVCYGTSRTASYHYQLPPWELPVGVVRNTVTHLPTHVIWISSKFKSSNQWTDTCCIW